MTITKDTQIALIEALVFGIIETVIEVELGGDSMDDKEITFDIQKNNKDFDILITHCVGYNEGDKGDYNRPAEDPEYIYEMEKITVPYGEKTQTTIQKISKEITYIWEDYRSNQYEIED